MRERRRRRHFFTKPSPWTSWAVVVGVVGVAGVVVGVVGVVGVVVGVVVVGVVVGVVGALAVAVVVAVESVSLTFSPHAFGQCVDGSADGYWRNSVWPTHEQGNGNQQVTAIENGHEQPSEIPS